MRATASVVDVLRFGKRRSRGSPLQKFQKISKNILTNDKRSYIIQLTTVVVIQKGGFKMARQNVTESEYELMKILWRAEKPMTIGDILKLLPENKWTRTTVSTLLVRLCDKNVIAYDSKGKYHYYYPVLKEKENLSV